MVRVAPGGDAEERGATTGCTAPEETPPDLQLQLAPGTYALQAGRSSCPGMPGKCAEDAYDEQYSREGAVWFCQVDVTLRAHQRVVLRVEASMGGPSVQCSVGA